MRTSRTIERIPLVDLGDRGIGELSSLTPDADGQGLFAADRDTGVVLDAGWKVERVIAFSRPVTEVVPLPADLPLGAGRFVDRGGGWQAVELFDGNGEVLWVIGDGDAGAVDQLAFASAPGGGVEFWVGFNASGGLERRNEQGDVIGSFSASNVFDVAVLDTAAERSVVTSDGDEIVWRDADGERSWALDLGSPTFSTCAWPALPGRTCLLVERSDELLVVSDEGEVVAHLSLPDPGGHDFRGAPFRTGDGSQGFAATATIKATAGLSLLVIYDAAGELRHAEVLGTSPITGIVPLAEGGFAVGIGSTIWRVTWSGPS